MASRFQIELLIAVSLINCIIARSPMSMILSTADTIKIAQEILNVAKTGNVDGMENPKPTDNSSVCSMTKSYADSLVFTLGAYMLEMDRYFQNTWVMGQSKIVAWVEDYTSLIDSNVALKKVHATMSEVDDKYDELLDTISRNFDNFTSGFDNEKLHVEEICKFSKSALKLITTTNAALLSSSYLTSISYHYEGNIDNKVKCDVGSSMNSYYYGMFVTTMLTHLKTFVVNLFSHYALDKYDGLVDGCAHEGAVITNVNNLKTTMDQHAVAFKRFLRDANRRFQSCDGPYFGEYSTHLELDNAIAKFIYLRLFTGDEHNDISCSDFNGKLHGDSVYYQPCDNTNLCSIYPKPCLGTLSDCEKISKYDNSDSICFSKNGLKQYYWIRSDSENYPVCHTDNVYLDRYYGLLKCMCTCSNHEPDAASTHIISLQKVEADVEDNKVVTGVRFTKQNGILYLQIQQGILLENGEIEEVEWKPIDDISIDVYASRTDTYTRSAATRPIAGKDFFVIEKDKTYGMNMDIIQIDNGYVLTGVHFTQAPEKARFQIAVVYRKFNYRTGKLDVITQPQSYTANWRDRFAIQTGSRATEWKPPLPISCDGLTGYIKFEAASDSENSPFTVPFFDYVSLESDPPSPLSGIEICVRTNENFAGIITTQLIQLDHSQIENGIYSN